MKVKNRIDQALNTSFGGLQMDLENFVEQIFGDKAKPTTSSHRSWVPRTDVAETDTQYSIKVELPGMNPDQVNVEFKEERLEVSGERTKTEPLEGEKVLRQEIATGNFVRSFEFSTDVDAEKISAEFKHGILQLTVPKAEKELPRKIQIKVSE